MVYAWLTIVKIDFTIGKVLGVISPISPWHRDMHSDGTIFRRCQ
jgi:hypothetical protein